MKIAILGLGSIGRRHLGNFRIAGVETLTAYDAAPAQRATAAKDFPFATITTTAEAALEGVDGAAICTPPESHIALGRMAAERGAHLMVEKPFAQSVEGVEELLKLCDAKRLKVLTAYNWRYRAAAVSSTRATPSTTCVGSAARSPR
jgi:predicted dehydrogenase